MIKISGADLRLAAHYATQIEQLEKACDEAKDTPVRVPVSSTASATHPLGVDVQAVVPATVIRAELREQLVPLYTALRDLGFELQR